MFSHKGVSVVIVIVIHVSLLLTSALCDVFVPHYHHDDEYLPRLVDAVVRRRGDDDDASFGGARLLLWLGLRVRVVVRPVLVVQYHVGVPRVAPPLHAGVQPRGERARENCR